ncbi:hypothetical protein XA26_04080 [Mycolicibacterium fortuitum]|uniref:Uncharacterized protein n=1 Tax=Mycolicibacterium fortuitum TaxID=1766 RepID=A0A0N9Y469_MYCFO|nr:hypothetical protein [Mycolicibacterium fortuitum]ALI24274.1 hypothetical protein XA26_04080 [Mycolicibacterium fortuitum]OBB27469.1 hypothetical protein A5763_02485 [Mycolicibacterium fortuitum]OBB42567.1 hypothetical protein A5754_14195 [Mycolicibacterium fortuitum]OBB62381.1 hypothetical protein A5755_23170 [Mycolicibacterium fortuitum]OBF84758.1 hypothetical protein A5751_11080 [Mycolicibacterium fortuitum]
MFTHLIALNPRGRRIVRVGIADGFITTVVSRLETFPDGIVVDTEKRHIYWTNMGTPGLPADHPPRGESDLDFYRHNGSLERAALDGSDRHWVVPEGGLVTGKQLAGAWSRRRLYWADREGAAVRSVALDGTGMRDEIVAAKSAQDRYVVRNQCVGVAVDERNGYLYWTQKGPSDGGDGRIFRAPLDIPAGECAADRTVEVLWEGLPGPIDIELDLDAGTLYWTDRGLPPSGNTLNRADIPATGRPGGDITVLSYGFHEAIGLAVDTDHGLAYVSDLSGEIRAVGLDGRYEALVAQVPGGLTGIAGI